MKQSTAWAGIHGLAGAALLVWSTAAAGQTTSGSVGGSSRVGATSAGGSSSGTGYSLSGGTSGSAISSGSSSSMGTTGSTSGGTGGIGGVGGTLGAGSSITSTGISNMDPFYSHYANPMYSGRVSSTGQTISGQVGGFGAPLYTISQTGTSSLGGITGTLSSTGQGMGGLGGYSNQGTTGRRGPAYTCMLAFPYDPPTPTRLQTELQQIISQSAALTSKDAIKVKCDGQVFVLEGTVPNDRERRLAEGLMRLTPGVRQVRNSLVVKATAASPKPGS